jgi:hypothetical protein
MNALASHAGVAILAGAVGSLLTTTLQTEEPSHAALAGGVDHGSVLTSIDARLESIDRQLSVRAKDATVPALAGDANDRDVGATVPATPSRPAPVFAETGEVPATRRDGTEAEPLPLMNEERIEEVRPFHQHPASRDQWMFSTEERVLRTFGAPSRIEVNHATERWIYVVMRGGQEWLTRSFGFHRGRLVYIH